MKDINELLSLSDDGKTIECCDDDISGDIVIPDGLENISEEAFAGAPITSVVMPDSIRYIGDSAFENCRELKSVVFPRNERLIIADNAFNGCTSLKTVEIPNGAVSIGELAFGHCTSLETVNIQTSLRQVGVYDMGGFFDDDESIFEGCAALKSVVMPYSAQMIFYDLPSLKTLRLLDGDETSGDFFIEECNALEEIEIPSSLKELSTDILSGLQNLKSISVSPDNPCYKSIDGVLFSKDGTELVFYPGNREGTAYSIPEGVETILENAFSGIDEHFESIKIPVSLKNLGYYEVYHVWQSIEVAEDNPVYKTVDGILYSKDGTILFWFPWEREVECFNIPNGVNVIGERAFSNSNVKNINIPDSVLKIGRNAFYYSALTSVSLPASIKYIGRSAFYKRRYLKEDNGIQIDLSALPWTDEEKATAIEIATLGKRRGPSAFEKE